MMESVLMRTLTSSKKGSSIVLASVMMIIVTLIAGIFFYNFVMGSVQSMTNNLNTQMSILLLDSVKINGTCISAWIRNTGSSAINVVNAYVNNEITWLANEVKVAASSEAIAYIGGTFRPGLVYTVKLAGMFGTLLTFEVNYQ
jgi:hypothetical protein